jgi:hypothetical protein
MDDRRSNGRTRISKAASLFFGGQTGVRACDVNLTDLTNGGAGIYKQGLAVLPLTFELSFDNLRRKCRLVWRKGNFFGVAFEHQGFPDSETQFGEADIAIPEPAFSILKDPPQHSLVGNADLSSDWMPSAADSQKNEGRGDLRFAIGVAVVLSLPVLIGASAFIATNAILKVN